MIVIAIDHSTERHLVLVKRRRVGRAPPIRHVGHDEDAELVRPVQLPRRFDLDVLAESREPDAPGAQDLVA